MSLDQLKVALQDYQRSYTTCVGISPKQFNTEQQATVSVSSKPHFVFEIPDPPEHLPSPEPELPQPVEDKETKTPERHPFLDQNGDYQAHSPLLESGSRKPPRPLSGKKKRGLNIMPILLGCLIMILGGIGYGLYDFYSSKKITTPSPINEIDINPQQPE